MKLTDRQNVYVSPGARVADDAVIYPGVTIEGECVIGSGAVIRSGSIVEDSVIGARTEVTSSVLTGAKVGEDCTVGPFAYLRKGADIANGCRIGDFVEVKNARIGERTKVAHLTYVGDCEIGKDCNIGCGAVFVNYDGKHKNRTVVGDRCFIGSNCNIIAPVSIKDGCYVAAGTTVTDDLDEGDFAIGRVKQVVKHGRARGRFC